MLKQDTNILIIRKTNKLNGIRIKNFCSSKYFIKNEKIRYRI